MQNKTSNPASNDFLRTLSATVTATAAIVGVHHYYRKQRQPEARLQDYVIGISAKMHSSAPLPRLQYAYQQTKLAYQNYPDKVNLKLNPAFVIAPGYEVDINGFVITLS